MGPARGIGCGAWLPQLSGNATQSAMIFGLVKTSDGARVPYRLRPSASGEVVTNGGRVLV